MLDIQFEIGGRKLDPCFIGDSVQKAVLLYVTRQIKERFKWLRIPDSDDPLRVLVKGSDIDCLHYELDGSSAVLDQIRERLGDVRYQEIVVTA